MNKNILYQIEKSISLNDFVRVLKESTLGNRRPINDLKRLQRMLHNSNLIATARIDNEVVGLARSISDFAYCTYLSDLAVIERFQNLGIGKELIRITKQASKPAKLILLSAPAAVDYYPKIGMTKHNHCFILDDAKELK